MASSSYGCGVSGEAGPLFTVWLLPRGMDRAASDKRRALLYRYRLSNSGGFAPESLGHLDIAVADPSPIPEATRSLGDLRGPEKPKVVGLKT